MKTLLLMSLLAFGLAAESAMATNGVPAVPLPILVEQRLNQSALSGPILKLGTQLTQKKVQVLKAVYDFAVLGGATGNSILMKDANGGDAVIPKGAIVKSVLISTPTPLTSGGSATLSFGMNSAAADFKAATAIATLNTAPRLVAGIQDGAVANMLRNPTYNQAVGVKIGTAAITAGKVVLYIEYYVGNPQE